MTAAGPHRANVGLAIAWFAAAVLLLAADGAAQMQPPALAAQATYYVEVHRSWSLALPAAFALFGALYLGMTPRFPVRLRPALGWAQLAVMSTGAALTKAPQFVPPWGDASRGDERALAAFRFWNGIAALGAAVLAVGLLLFLWALVDGLRRRRPG